MLTLPEIKQGILFQGATVGIREAYNLFCQEQERAIYVIALKRKKRSSGQITRTMGIEYLAVKARQCLLLLKCLVKK